jgi:hypothetical protein
MHSLVKIYKEFGVTYCFHVQSWTVSSSNIFLFSYMAYFSTVKMEAVRRMGGIDFSCMFWITVNYFCMFENQIQTELLLPPWNSPFHFSLLDLSHSVGLLGRVISSSQGLYLYTITKKCTHTHTNSTHPCPDWDSNPRSRLPNERRQCMPLGYRDRQLNCLHEWKLYDVRNTEVLGHFMRDSIRRYSRSTAGAKC